MEKLINFIEALKKCLQPLGFEDARIDPTFKQIDVEGGRITLDVYRTEKISKGVFSSIEIDSLSVREQSVIIWPDDDYDLPVFWCNLTQMPGLSFHIFDLIPLMDIVLWPEYGEQYLTGLPEIKQKTMEQLDKEIAEKNFDLTSPVCWSFSPYRILLKLTDKGLTLLELVLEEYGTAYASLWEKARLVEEPEKQAFARRKREAVRQIMKENDPGHPLMVDIFGEERTTKVFDIVF